MTVAEPRSALDPTLFAENPARDARFVVKDRWIEMFNTAGDDPLHEVEFTHRQMNEEMNGLECSARGLSDFPDADWDTRMRLARQCADEARHVRMFRRLLHRLGGHVGQFPVMNFQYRIITKADSLVGRLTIQNRTFEAGGLDAVSAVVDQMRERGDDDLTLFFDSQLADEILHVRYANEYIRHLIRDDPRTVLRIGSAMTQAAKAFKQVMGSEGTEGVSYPIDRQARLEAGFTAEEVAMAMKANGE
ncbi:MAG TPA: DUF455 family protein [Candidatus Acidoferrum sp.]|nr:DUF455 family protein [Candidatus Acidoferrum sp.]